MSHPHQRAYDFETDKAMALNVHTSAIRQAQADFEAAMATIKADYASRYEIAQRFDAVKSDAAHPMHDKARKAFYELRTQGPDFRPAYAERATATARADSAYHNAISRLREQHGRTPIPSGRQ